MTLSTQQFISQTRPVVLFSQNYLPMARINLRRAAILLVTNRAEPLDFGAQGCWQLRSPQRVLDVPEHLRLTVGGSERVWKVPPVNRREVLRRDQHTCQYCGSKQPDGFHNSPVSCESLRNVMLSQNIAEISPSASLITQQMAFSHTTH